MINNLIKGIPISSGKVFGNAFVFNEEELVIPRYISTFDLEQARLGQAIQSSKLELNRLKKYLTDLSVEEMDLFKNYLMILDDPELLKKTLIKIRNESINAEWALNNVAASKPNRSALRDVTSNLIDTLLKRKRDSIDKLTEPVILVGQELTLPQVASLDPKMILGFLTDIDEGSTLTSILARGLKIPAITGLTNITSIIKNGYQIILDGNGGTIIINPSPEQLKDFKNSSAQVL